MERHWLDWSEPFLPAAAEWLIARHRGEERHVDLQRFVCVTPGRRAGRILTALLVEGCEREGLALLPPRTITPGDLAGELLITDGALASATERLLAWMHALRTIAPARIAPLLRDPPDAADLLAWHDLARSIAVVYDELAGEGIRFDEVAPRAEGLELFAEGDRWRALADAAGAYAEALAASGLVDPDATRRAALADERIEGDVELVLLGVTDLTFMQREIVDAYRERTQVLVHAPASLADHFDAYGGVDVEAWSAGTIGVTDAQIITTEGPDDQARAAMNDLAGLGGVYSADEITIGIGAPELVESVSRAAKWAGVGVHRAQGLELRASGPYRLLAAIEEFLEDRRLARFAALVRHPDLEKWLAAQPDASAGDAQTDRIVGLDRYLSEHLDELGEGKWLGEAKKSEPVRAAWNAVARLLAPLGGGVAGGGVDGGGESGGGKRDRGDRDDSGERKPLATWNAGILSVLTEVYGDLEVGSPSSGASRAAVDACLALRDSLSELAATPAALLPPAEAHEAVSMLLMRTQEKMLPVDPHANEIELLDWLELHMDPAPALTLIGVNDGSIPSVVGSDPFLPDVLRRTLGLTDSRKRYARDAYLLEAIRRSRKHLRVVCGRVSASGEPLAPSRLLLACDDETMLRRVTSLFGERSEGRHPRPFGAPRPGAANRFTVPELKPAPAVPESMTVTEFRDYINCPYRYALARRLRLERVGDEAVELDGLQFGTLVHAVLEGFGRDEGARDSTDPDRISGYLVRSLEAIALRRFGTRPRPAVRLQIARAEERLHAFAREQTRARAEGWVIRHTEFAFENGSHLDVPDQSPMPIRGRIDRIDQNEHTGKWRVIDYKTGERGDSPFKTHHGRTKLPSDGSEPEWLDLQLPLYHFLLRQRGLIATEESGDVGDDGDDGHDMELAFFVLPKKADDARVIAADWSPVHLDAAIELARDIVRRIRAGEYAMNPNGGSKFDPFARICQSTAFNDDEADDSTEGGAS